MILHLFIHNFIDLVLIPTAVFHPFILQGLQQSTMGILQLYLLKFHNLLKRYCQMKTPNETFLNFLEKKEKPLTI